VRSGLVITSTSFSVVSASAVPDIIAAKTAAVSSLFMVVPPFGLWLLLSGLGSGGDRRLQITPQGLGSFQADMETHGPRMYAEGMCRIGLGLLLQHDLTRHD
jgi:hypothetical protein